MNIDTAYNEVWTSLRTLAEKGVKFEVRPSSGRRSRELQEKYEHKLPVNKWCHVTFYVNDAVEDSAIIDEVNRLAKMNIGFDTGGGFGLRDWEIDWSLELLDDEHLTNMMIRKGQLSNLIDELENSE